MRHPAATMDTVHRMGGLFAPSAVDREELMQRNPGNITFEIIAGANMPNTDGPGDASDCYCKVSLVTKTGEFNVALPVTTSVCRETLEPVWHTFVSFPVVPEDSDRIKIEVLDKDYYNDDYIGFVREAVGLLPPGSPVTRNLTLVTKVKPPRPQLPATLTFRLVSIAKYPAVSPGDAAPVWCTPERKTLFIIRHGESIWNEAKSHMHVVQMCSQYDHELNATGIAQVRSPRPTPAAATSGSGPVLFVSCELSSNGLRF